MKAKLTIEIEMDLNPNEDYLPAYVLPEKEAIYRFKSECNKNLTYLVGTLEDWSIHDRIEKWNVIIKEQ